MGNCARPSIAPLLFRGVWAAAVIHGAALALDLALGLAVSRRWLNNQLSKATHRALCRFAPSVRCGLVQGAYGPPNPPCSPRSIRPLAVLRGGHFEPGGWPMPTEFDYTITPVPWSWAAVGTWRSWKMAKPSVVPCIRYRITLLWTTPKRCGFTPKRSTRTP